MLSTDETKLYERQIALDEWGMQGQEKLKKAHAFVAGAGGLGSSVLYYLAAAGVGTLTICDFDRVDISNLNRQVIHNQARLGFHKSISAKKTIERLNPYITVNALTEKLERHNVERIIGSATIIMDCLDNFGTRAVLNEYSVRNSVPLVHAGVSEFQGQVSFLHPPETPCLNCIIPVTPEKRKKIIPIVGSTAGVIGSLQSSEALRYLLGETPALRNRILFWDGANMRFDTIQIKKNPACRICSRERGTK